MAGRGWLPFRRPHRLAVRLAAASLAVVLPALLILTLTVRQVVRDNAVDAAFEGQAAPRELATTGVYSEAFEQEGRRRGW